MTAPPDKKLGKKFGEHIQDVWSHKSLGTSKFLIVCPMVEIEKISAEDQQ